MQVFLGGKENYLQFVCVDTHTHTHTPYKKEEVMIPKEKVKELSSVESHKKLFIRKKGNAQSNLKHYFVYCYL